MSLNILANGQVGVNWYKNPPNFLGFKGSRMKAQLVSSARRGYWQLGDHYTVVVVALPDLSTGEVVELQIKFTASSLAHTGNEKLTNRPEEEEIA